MGLIFNLESTADRARTHLQFSLLACAASDLSEGLHCCRRWDKERRARHPEQGNSHMEKAPQGTMNNNKKVLHMYTPLDTRSSQTPCAVGQVSYR